MEVLSLSLGDHPFLVVGLSCLLEVLIRVVLNLVDPSQVVSSLEVLVQEDLGLVVCFAPRSSSSSPGLPV